MKKNFQAIPYRKIIVEAKFFQMVNRFCAVLFATLALLFMDCSIAYGAEKRQNEQIVKFGISLPLSGSYGLYGLEARDVISAYIDQFNKSGGVNGKKIALLVEDDKGDPSRAVENSKRFASDPQVLAALSYMGAEAAERSVNEVLIPEKVPLIGAISGTETLRRSITVQPNNRYVFNVRAGHEDEIRVIVKQLDSLGLRRIAIYSSNEMGYKAMADHLDFALKNEKLNSVTNISRPGVASDIREAIKTIRRINPQALIISCSFTEAAPFIRAIRRDNLAPQIIITSEVGADMLSMELTENDSRGVGAVQVMPYPWDETIPLVKEYSQLLRNIQTASVSYIGLEAFVVAKVAVEALRRTGAAINREKFVQALDNIKIDLGGYSVAFSSADHRGSRFVELTVIGARGHILR